MLNSCYDVGSEAFLYMFGSVNVAVRLSCTSVSHVARRPERLGWAVCLVSWLLIDLVVVRLHRTRPFSRRSRRLLICDRRMIDMELRLYCVKVILTTRTRQGTGGQADRRPWRKAGAAEAGTAGRQGPQGTDTRDDRPDTRTARYRALSSVVCPHFSPL